MLSFGEKEKTGVPGKNLLEASGGENRNKKNKGQPFLVRVGGCCCFYQVLKHLRADVSKYRPEVYKTEKSKILKKIHKVALGKLLT